MTVAELIVKLQKLDPSLRVVGPGYEGGYYDVKVFEPFEIALNVNTEWYYGPHEGTSWRSTDFSKFSKYEKVMAICL